MNVLGVLALAMTIASGWFLARTLTSDAWKGPRWIGLLAELSIGALFGPGLASILYFFMVAAGAANRASVMLMLLAVLAGTAAAWWRSGRVVKKGETQHAEPARAFRWTWALWIGVAVGLIFFTLDFQAASSANPAGEWDAMSIWNLRARYLASGGELWQRAVSSDLGGNMAGAAHPGYPLFLSGFIGLQWSAEGGLESGFEASVPIAASLLFAASALILLGGSLASRRSIALGLLAWLILLCSEVFASQSAAQYSDLLQGLAFLCALVLLEAAADRADARLMLGAGLAIGLACWIKNEGLPFALAALGVAAWRFRLRGILWVGAGALPGFFALAALKLFFAHGSEAVFPGTVGEAMSKIAGAGRWWKAALGFGKAVYDAGNLWTHPVLLAALLAIALGFVPAKERRARLWLVIPIAATAAAEYSLYLVTTADLDWHISTSVSRLVAQLWPSLIWFFFLMLREPEETIEPELEPVAVRAGPGGKRKRRGGASATPN